MIIITIIIIIVIIISRSSIDITHICIYIHIHTYNMYIHIPFSRCRPFFATAGRRPRDAGPGTLGTPTAPSPILYYGYNIIYHTII